MTTLLILILALVPLGQWQAALQKPTSDRIDVATVAAPEYPELARRAAVRRPVVFDLSVDRNGRIAVVRLVEGHPLFDQTARRALAGWVFTPDVRASEFRTVRLTFAFGMKGPADNPWLETFYGPPHGSEFVYHVPRVREVLRLPASEKTRKRCSVHQQWLQLDVVSISYGLQLFSKEYEKAREKLFPESYQEFGGGCILEETSKAEVLYCSKCRAVENGWKRATGIRY